MFTLLARLVVHNELGVLLLGNKVNTVTYKDEYTILEALFLRPNFIQYWLGYKNV